MRILWFSHRDIESPRSGGVERSIFEISRRLVARGDEVIWASIRWPGGKAASVVEGVRILRIRGRVAPHLMVPSTIRLCKAEVIIDDLGHVVPWFSEWVSERPGTAFFHHLHARTLPGQVAPLRASLLTMTERAYRRIYRRWPFVTESEQSVRDLNALGIPANRVVRIPPGVDLAHFHPGTKSVEPSMVYFGGFREYKRPWVPGLIYQALRDRFPGLKLWMVGDGPSRQSVQAAVSEGEGDGIRFLGRIGDASLASVVSSAWLNLHSSVAEGWGLSILEAAAAGTPTVAYAVPGVAETVRPAVNGITVPDGDLRGLTEAAARILSSRDRWVRPSRGWAEGFTWENATDRWRNHLQSLLKD